MDTDGAHGPRSITYSYALVCNLCSSHNCCEHLQICVIRTLAFDENKAERAQRGLDLGALDAMTWPEYVWEYLYMHEDDLRNHRHALPLLWMDYTTVATKSCCLWAFFDLHQPRPLLLCVIKQQSHSC